MEEIIKELKEIKELNKKILNVLEFQNSKTKTSLNNENK